MSAVEVRNEEHEVKKNNGCVWNVDLDKKNIYHMI